MSGPRPPQNSLYGTPNGLQGNLYPNIITTRDPDSNDTGYYFGQMWVNKFDGTVHILASVNSGMANWIPVGSGSGNVSSLTGNTGGGVTPLSGNIDIVGSGSINVAGTSGTLTITSTATSNAIQYLAGNSGGNIAPAAGIVNVVGSGMVSVAGTGNTLTISASTTGFVWNNVSAFTNIVANNGYFCNASGGSFNLTLPASPTIGDTYRVCLVNSGGNQITINYNANQFISLGKASTTVTTGNVTTTSIGDSLEIVYAGSNQFQVLSCIGNITIN